MLIKIPDLFKNKRIIIFTGLICIVVLIGVANFFISQTSPQNARGAVVSNAPQCAQVGAEILLKGGTAVDAAIAALFCEGVFIPQSLGIGGGFLMAIHDAKTGKTMHLDSREVAPAAAIEDMFQGDASLATRGALAAAVPGEVRGYWTAYKKFGGGVPWSDLVQPAINFCKNGITVTNFLEETILSCLDIIQNDPGLREVYINPSTNQPYKANETIKMLKLARTLEIIAKEGGDALHNGSLTENFVKDIREAGGIITEEDLKNFKPIFRDSIKIELPSNQILFTAPLPGGGVLLGFIMNILNGFLDLSEKDAFVNHQRIIESFKFGFGRRTELGDAAFVEGIDELINNLTSPEYASEIRKLILDNRTFEDPSHYGATSFQKDDHGTTHLGVLAANGDAVSVTSTININFGSGFTSASTGILLNDQMDDFSSPNVSSFYGVPPSPSNFIRPGKHPLSSMCPSIILDRDKKVRLIIGGAGGTRITTAIVLIMIKNLWFNRPIDVAIGEKRFHHQLLPMEILFEEEYKNDKKLVEFLQNVGHKCNFIGLTGFTALTAIAREQNQIRAAFDPRRPGSVAYIH